MVHVANEDHFQAIDARRETVTIGAVTFNPRLHLAIHEIIAAQLFSDDPPEVWSTARRLRDAGYERHEILHMLGSALTETIWRAYPGEAADPEAYVRSLALLPGSWPLRRHRKR